jgi:hypothetical protein
MFQCIINRYYESIELSPFYPVKVMLDEKFLGNKFFENTIVILGYNLGNKIDYYRKLYPNHKIIVYQLEQLYNNMSLWYNKKSKNSLIKQRTEHITDWLTKCDEIWDYDIDNKMFLKSEGFKNIKFLPMSYTKGLKNNYHSEVEDYILFFGSINEKRAKILSEIKKYYKIKIVGEYSMMSPKQISFYGLGNLKKVYGKDLEELISKSKIILNLHYYDSNIQEQVRLFPLIINNKCILSEKSKRNYFGDIITEFTNLNDLKSKLDFLIVDSNRKIFFSNISERFENKNLMDIKIGASYNTFYGVRNLEKSIESIRNITNYIVVVHQKIGFDGVTEPEYNQKELDRLQSLGYIDEIIYYNVKNSEIHSGILEKRNLGLESCKKKGCEYIITLDSDELYNDLELYDDIIKMKEKDVKTLYYKIKTYYHSENYFFIENYFVPSVYKIDGRKYEKGVKTSLIVDPVRKQKESTFILSSNYMHHHSYFLEDWREKLSKKVSLKLKTDLNGNEIINNLINWDESKPAKIFINDSLGNLKVKEIKLHKINEKNKTHNPKDLSVIIPTYKNTQYIDECLNSIIESSQNESIEILVGIDACEETLKYIKTKSYPDFIKFYYFNENLGPYIIKNSLTQITNSDKFLFFDSDDIMTKDTIREVIDGLKTYDVIRLRYQNYINGKINGKDSFGEGVIGLTKNKFLELNGYEPWKVAADSDFNGRLYKSKPKIYHTKNVSFYYRQHQTSLTKRPDTGLGSQLRSSYWKLRKKKGNPDKLNTKDFIILDIDTVFVETKNYDYYQQRKSKLDKVLNPAPRKVVNQPIKKKDPVINDRTDLLYTNPKPLTRTIKPNKPDNRQELINLKNNTNKSVNKQLFSTKPERRTGINHITIGGKSKL